MNKTTRMVVINTALLEYYSKGHFLSYIYFEGLCKIDFRKDLYILHLEYSIRFNLLFISDLIAKLKNVVRLIEIIIFKQFLIFFFDMRKINIKYLPMFFYL